MLAALAATRPALLGALQARHSPPEPAFAGQCQHARATFVPERQAAFGGGDFCGDEERSPGVARAARIKN